ncbi:MAG: CARDB domain-containing protein [Chthonomonadales bacterium]
MKIRSVLTQFIIPVIAVLGIASPAIGQSYHFIPIPAQHIVYDNQTKRIYACVGSSGEGKFANSIVPIDVLTGNVEAPVLVGTEPGVMAISDKSKYLYVAINDLKAIRRMSLGPLASGPLYQVGEGLIVNALMPFPGNPEAFIAQRQQQNVSPNDAGVAVYVNGTANVDIAGMGHTLMPGIDPLRLVGYETQISSWSFVNSRVNADGVLATSSSGSVMSGNTWFVANLNGLLITNGGSVVDPESRTHVGKLPNGTGAFVGDPDRNVMFQVTCTNNVFEINKYDLKQFQKLDSMSFKVDGSKGGGRELICAGPGGLAFIIENGIVIVNANYGPKVPSVDLSVKRSEFTRSASGSGEMTYTLTVKNNSTIPSSGAYLSDTMSGNIDITDVTASQGTATGKKGIVSGELGVIAPGASATVKVKIIPHVEGNPVFVAVVRGDEPDNNTPNNISIYEPASTELLPDLTGEWNALQQVSRGAGVNLESGILGSFTVKNIGKASSVSTIVRFYVSEDPRLQVEFSPLVQERQIPALKPGQTYAVSLEAFLGATDITGLYIHASIDPNKRMRESNKGNNVVGRKVP